MSQSHSPEEKLLKLIRGEKQKRQATPINDVDVGEQPRVTKPQRHSLPKNGRRHRGLKLFNMILMPLTAFCAVYLIYDIVNYKSAIYTVGDIENKVMADGVAPAPATSGTAAGVNSFFACTEAISSRQLFKALKSDTPQEKPSYAKAGQAEDMVGSLSLIGIIAGDSPQAAIEDKKSQKTYFLYKGQIINQIEVQDILEDRVILNVNGNRYELAL